MEINALSEILRTTLDTNKAIDIQELDVTKLTDMTDRLIICSATSERHLQALKEKIIEESKAQGVRPIYVDSQPETGWIIVDLNDIIVHIMLPSVRDFYHLEKLWSLVKINRNTGTTQ